jgi:hypothetical protein
MRVIFTILLSLSIIAQLTHGESQPTIELLPDDTLEILDPAVVQSGSSVAVSGRVKCLIPWARHSLGSYRDIAL